MPLLASHVYARGSRTCGLLTRIAFGASTRALLITHRKSHGGVVTLSYDLYDGKAPGPPLVLLHGLFGSKSNFQSIARALVRRIGRKVLTLDARNHGSSPHCDIITYPTMSADVRHLLEQLNISSCVLIGHSMGGKIAMTLALQEPQMVERLVSVDISPSPTVPQIGFPQYIKVMQNIHLEGKMPRSRARRLAEEQLSATVKEASVRQFLLTNLVQENGHFKWRVNLDAISNHLQDILDFPEFQCSYPGPTLFLGGANSPYISSENYPDIERLFPCANVEYIQGAGHWVHAEQTKDFLNAICNFVETT
ncbi:sn-1-specific diacylglycerol lipase ABHD11 isoform X1 [Rhinoderma darwinii]|uniref:sn-1-specific diacylglycerol lipase ABHD11 isoform X1 n=1 Tax=Rhinoderma darwinii TaxID=43563 RepID=UPI003F672960